MPEGGAHTAPMARRWEDDLVDVSIDASLDSLFSSLSLAPRYRGNQLSLLKFAPEGLCYLACYKVMIMVHRTHRRPNIRICASGPPKQMPLHPYCTGVVGIGTFWHIVFVTDGAPQPSQLINHCNYRSTIAATSTDQPLQLPTNYCNYLSTLASTDQPLKPPINHCNY